MAGQSFSRDSEAHRKVHTHDFNSPYRYARSEIRFNLMAIIKNRQAIHTEQIEALQKQRSQLEARLNEIHSGSSTTPSEAMEVDTNPASRDELLAKIAQIEDQLNSTKHKMEVEAEKFKHWKVSYTCAHLTFLARSKTFAESTITFHF